MPPLTFGTQQTVDINTGQVTGQKEGAFTLLPPDPSLCQECAADHGPADPHNQQSLYYRMKFQAENGRMPTWSDAMAHCSPSMQSVWRRTLVAILKSHNLDIPADLQP